MKTKTMKKWTFLLIITPSIAFMTTVRTPITTRFVRNIMRTSSSCTGSDDADNDDIPPPSTSIFFNTTSTTTTTPTINTKRASKSKRLYSFDEARRIARGHGFDTYQEFVEYSCPGAYQIPKDADVVWNEEWKGWDDFLGLPLSFLEARSVARSLTGITDEESYLVLMESKASRIPDDDIASRLPYRPDLKHKSEWMGWDDFLNSAS